MLTRTKFIVGIAPKASAFLVGLARKQSSYAHNDAGIEGFPRVYEQSGQDVATGLRPVRTAGPARWMLWQQGGALTPSKHMICGIPSLGRKLSLGPADGRLAVVCKGPD